MVRDAGILGALILNPLAIALTAGCGVVICAAAGWNRHGHEMLVAGGVLLAASELAMLPLILTRGANQLTVSQAALLATMVHLFVAAAAMLAIKSSPAFHAWLLGFYAATVISVVIVCIRAVRAAPMALSGNGNH